MTTITPGLKETIQREGYAKSGDIGGQPKTTYWTPDGRILKVAPSWHEYVQKDDKGKVIASGIRDANLDKGWLLQKPTNLQIYCPHCDQWHKTQKEIAECERRHSAIIKHSTLKMQRLMQPQEYNDRLAKVEADVGEIKTLLRQLIKDK